VFYRSKSFPSTSLHVARFARRALDPLSEFEDLQTRMGCLNGGVLTVRIPKGERNRPREIEVSG
jgi:hypothetical protein